MGVLHSLSGLIIALLLVISNQVYILWRLSARGVRDFIKCWVMLAISVIISIYSLVSIELEKATERQKAEEKARKGFEKIEVKRENLATHEYIERILNNE